MTSTYERECLFIQKVIKEKFGIDISVDDCFSIWEQHSEEVCASWLNISENNYDIANIIDAYVKYGPSSQVDELFRDIKRLDQRFRLILLTKISKEFCFLCGAPMTFICMNCAEKINEEEDES